MRTSIVALSLVAALGCGSTSEAPNSHSSSATGAAVGTPASPARHALAGMWTGQLVGQHDTIDDARIRINDTGHLMYEYATREGATGRVEWASAGQKIEFVPPGGGVQRITIESIDSAADHVTMTQKWVFEKSGNFLTQNFLTSQVELSLAPDGLKVTMSNATENFMNGNPSGSESETYVGVLKKQ